MLGDMNKKFRAYYKPDLDTPDGALKFEQKEIYGELFFVYDDDILYPFQIPFIDYDWVVQQYVYIQDKNGIDVYEGDIIKYDNHDDTVIIRMTTEEMDYHPGWILDDLFTQYGPYEIIGNIFENPELVEKK
jgi:hypothetical protein